jgi:hypothetical protein
MLLLVGFLLGLATGGWAGYLLGANNRHVEAILARPVDVRVNISGFTRAVRRPDSTALGFFPIRKQTP